MSKLIPPDIMKAKINLNRILLGGLLGGIVLDVLSFLVHGVILGDKYMFFQKAGSVLAQPRLMPVQILLTVLSGFPLAILYVIGRSHLGSGPRCAVIIGALVGLMNAAGAMAVYSYYNMGAAIPALTFLNNFVGYILATLVAGMIYKDKTETASA